MQRASERIAKEKATKNEETKTQKKKNRRELWKWRGCGKRGKRSCQVFCVSDVFQVRVWLAEMLKRSSPNPTLSSDSFLLNFHVFDRAGRSFALRGRRPSA